MDYPSLPARAFKKALFKDRPATLEGGGGDPPAAPDPYATAQAQAQYGEQAAQFNKALNSNNYSNPFGSQQSSIIGTDPQTGAPIYQTNITANPQLQSALTSLLGQTGASGQQLSSAMSGISGLTGKYQGLMGGLGALQSQISPTAAQDYAKQGQDAYYKSATAYLDPQYAQQQTSLDAKLANQGITPGSEAYNNAMGNFQRDKDFAYNQAANSAITQGQQMGLNQLQEQEGAVNTQAGLYGLMGQNLGAQGALFGQQAGLSQVPYQNLQTIAQMMPGYSGPGQANTNASNIAQYMQNAYQGRLNAYNADVASNNQTESTAASLGAIALMALA
jgi:hypothetical protein